jgi:hypothetical protein
MQEATPTSGSSQLLYDSHTPPAQSPAIDRSIPATGPWSSRESRRSISSPRKGSIGQNSRPVIIQQETNPPRTFGAFDRRPHHTKTHSFSETEGQRSAREYREEVTTFSNCIFGNSEVLAYKGTGTKVHILPTESRTPMVSSSYMGDNNSSFGRSGMRSSKLAQSFTSDTVHGPTSAGFTSPSISLRGGDRKKVLITRMFPVPLPNDDSNDAVQDTTPTPQNLQMGETTGYPFPKDTENRVDTQAVEFKKPQPKQKRTPMYAVGLVVQLPQASHVPSISASRSSFRGPGSYTEQESYPSSFNSTRRSGWIMLGHGFESLESSFSSDVDDRIDIITQHWDIIMRTLSHLQAVATGVLLPMLKQADISSPEPRRESMHTRAPSASVSISGKRVLEEIKPFKAPKTNAKLVQLNANCLMQVQKIHKEVDAARYRIVNGIRANQVITGQGRWGIWREEARLVGKWAGGKDEGFFFFNLLTGFLGNHTEWLQALGPSWYRRRHHQQQRSNKDDDVSLPARTIIVSDNKLMARRLIFLLSAFLPSNQQVVLPGRFFHRPSTSASFGGYSQSPPNYAVPVLREEPLRRKINNTKARSTGVPRANHSRTMSSPNQIVQLPANLGPEIQHDRRPSDATSIKTANLPIPGSDLNTRKSSTATTSTATPVTTMPHFSTRHQTRGTGPIPRPGSSGSLATEDLKRSLHRGGSSGQYSNASTDSHGQNSQWGSMISKLWGSSKTRESSTSTSVEKPPMDGLQINDPHYRAPNSPLKRDKLVDMVEEATSLPIQKGKEQQEREQRKSESGSASTAKPEDDQTENAPEQIVQPTPRIPDPTGAYESPVKTSINEHDGVIDIDVPLPDYLAYETAVSSPSSSGYLSTPGFGNAMEAFERYSRNVNDLDTTINVGGWLQRYHPDFSLQAIPVQADLLEDVKASMRAEPTPIIPHPLDSSRGDRWVDISSAVIADTTNFSIKLIRYRRLIRVKDPLPALNNSNHVDSRYGNVYSAAQLTPAIDIYEGHLDERFIEEPIISMDETLIDAVERIIAQSGRESKTSSICSSRSTSRRGGNRERSNSDGRVPGIFEHKLEVPRNECKKMVLTALEEIVREVQESRREKGDTESDTERESFLREGVRNWLSSIETQE